jgi:Mg2+/citrate symporter
MNPAALLNRALLGVAMVATFMTLILTKRMSASLDAGLFDPLVRRVLFR